MLAEENYDWKCGETYTLTAILRGHDIMIMIDGQEKIRYTDTSAPYLKGQVGFGVYDGSRCRFESLKVTPTK